MVPHPYRSALLVWLELTLAGALSVGLLALPPFVVYATTKGMLALPVPRWLVGWIVLTLMVALLLAYARWAERTPLRKRPLEAWMHAPGHAAGTWGALKREYREGLPEED